MGDHTLAACDPTPPAGPLDRPTRAGRSRDRGIPLDGPVRLFHLATDRLDADTVPESYRREVAACPPAARVLGVGR